MNILQNFVPLVRFLGEAIGPNAEVVLHDLSTPDKSIIAIANGHISGRAVGGPATDLVLKVLKEGLDSQNNYIAAYQARLKNNRSCRASSFFIRDASGAIIGVLCVNIDVSVYTETRKLLDSLINCAIPAPASEKTAADVVEVFENLHESIDDVLTAIIDNVLNKYEVSPERMSVEEKIDVVRRLNENGLFLLKGGLSELARRMQISEPTIYRYINKIK
ncbi:MAG: PAS domain-containing protein [Sporomusaceae bacterium]|nr:PAS domain-containing protein [Sporomusaceae bacterium]